MVLNPITSDLGLAVAHSIMTFCKKPPEELEPFVTCAIYTNLKTAATFGIRALCGLFEAQFGGADSLQKYANDLKTCSVPVEILPFLDDADPYDAQDTVGCYMNLLQALEWAINEQLERCASLEEDCKVLQTCLQEVKECRERMM